MVESVFPWVFKKRAAKTLADEVAQDLLRKEPAAWFKHTPNFSQCLFPVGNVMNNPKIESGIIAAIRCRKLSGISDPKIHRCLFLSISAPNGCPSTFEAGVTHFGH